MQWIKSGTENPLAVLAGMKKPNDHAEPTKVERKEKERFYVTEVNEILMYVSFT